MDTMSSFLLSLPGGTNQGIFFSVISQTPGDLGQMIPRTHVFHLSERADESLPLAVRQHWKAGKAMISLEAAHNTSADRLLLC
jgi:hypothetical protein